MSGNNDSQELADAKQANAELEVSLERCRKMLSDCREQLIANGNEPKTPAADEEAAG